MAIFIVSGELWVAHQILQGSELVGSCSSLCMLSSKTSFPCTPQYFHHVFLVANVFLKGYFILQQL